MRIEVWEVSGCIGELIDQDFAGESVATTDDRSVRENLVLV